MDFLKILDAMKDKILDEANLEKLKSAYNVQKESIKQLRVSNDSLRENSELLEERVRNLEAAIHHLRIRGFYRYL